MPSFSNGRFPLSMFEHIEGNIYLPAATAARVRGFIADVKAETGVTLRITGNIDGLGGWNGYRPFDAQVRYKAHYGRSAAEAGKSSHGGVFQGRDFFAVDFANSGEVPWPTFVRLARKWGLMTDFVTPTERWHVGDPNPWSMPASTGWGSSTDTEGFLMALSDTQQRQIYEALVVGGPSASAYYKTDALINIVRTELGAAVASIAAGGILYPGQPYLMADAIVNAIRADDNKVAIDEAQIAANLAPVLAPLISANLGALSDEAVNNLVKRLLDEQAKRMAG